MSCHCISSEGDTIECGECSSRRLQASDGASGERARIVARLRSRATSERVTADRWAHGGDDRMTALHTKAAEVLEDECERLEKGI